jgi:hypothetical protein
MLTGTEATIVSALFSSLSIARYASQIAVDANHVPVLGTNVAAVLLGLPEQLAAQLCDARMLLSKYSSELILHRDACSRR